VEKPATNALRLKRELLGNDPGDVMQDRSDQLQPLPFSRNSLAGYEGRHFKYQAKNSIALIMLSRPERKNPLTFDSYAELRDLFRAMAEAEDIHVIVLTGDGGNFCSGGDVHEIIGPLTKLDMPGLLAFTRMTGNVVKAMRNCPQPIIAAIDGVCAGAGALLALASDLRLGTARSKTAFLFTRVGLAGCDMGACALLPRVIGQGRAAELLFTGRSMTGEEAERWGFLNRLCTPENLLSEAEALAAELASGPTFAHGMTKKMLHQEWNMGVDEAIESEAQAQAICMATKDFHRAYEAFVARQKPVFKGN
jgi:enoyl-CoA hydratase/carnithine racemase